jgi:hypothetical protein
MSLIYQVRFKLVGVRVAEYVDKVEVRRNDSASAYVLCPFDLGSFQFRKSGFQLKSDDEQKCLSQACRV